MSLNKVVLVLLLLNSCRALTYERRQIEIGPVEIKIPKSWDVFPLAGIDSYVGVIITEKKDSIFYEYGDNVDPLEEKLPVFYPVDIKDKFNGIYRDETDTFIFLNEAEFKKRDSVKNTYRKQENKYVQISKHTAKLVWPNKIGTGLTGVYIKDVNSDYQFFVLKSYNLDSNTHIKLLNSIYSIKINKNKIMAILLSLAHQS